MTKKFPLKDKPNKELMDEIIKSLKEAEDHKMTPEEIAEYDAKYGYFDDED